MIKAIIFDFDGTLVESMDVKTKAFAYLFRNYPDKVADIVDLHIRRGGMSRFEKLEIIYRDILKEPLTEEKRVEFGKQFSDYVYKGVVESPFVVGAEEFLKNYYDKVPFFVASGTPDAEMKAIVNERGLGRYFKEVFGSPAKKGEIIFKILQDFGFPRKETVFVGDAIDDEEGAKEAGIQFIWRKKDNNPFQELEKLMSC